MITMNTTTNYKALDIASFFIKKGVSPLKLQKLLYYSQVWFFVKNKNKLFEDKISAWIFGPVVYDVWSNFKFVKRCSIIPESRANEASLNDVVLNHLEDVWKAYGHLSGSELVDLSHSELPWKNSRKGLLDNEPSDNEVIIDKSTTVDFILGLSDHIPTPKIEGKSLGRYSSF